MVICAQASILYLSYQETRLFQEHAILTDFQSSMDFIEFPPPSPNRPPLGRLDIKCRCRASMLNVGQRSADANQRGGAALVGDVDC